MKRLKANRLLPVLTLAICAAACSVAGYHGNGDDNYYSAFRTIDNARWDYTSPAAFSVDTLRDSICPSGLMLLSIRHTNGYEYRNLWLEVKYDSDSTARIDTLNIILADRLGRWRGHGSGPSIALTDTLGIMPLHKGQQIRVRHIMRTDCLDGIEQVGISYLPEK